MPVNQLRWGSKESVSRKPWRHFISLVPPDINPDKSSMVHEQKQCEVDSFESRWVV